MRVSVLGSGSSGNCIYVEAEGMGLLIDAGLSARQTVARLEMVGGSVDRLAGVCLSHEHNDHTTGLRTLARRYHLPVYANAGTIEGLAGRKVDALSWQVFTTGSPFVVGALQCCAFPVSHDAYEPVGFTVQAAGIALGIVTDVGVVTHLVRERLRACDVLILESNHDEQMLMEATRPWSLKQRIRGRQGHLSNRHACELLVELAGPHLRQVFLAHLSRDCNCPRLAEKEARTALDRAGHQHVRLVCAEAGTPAALWSSGETPVVVPEMEAQG